MTPPHGIVIGGSLYVRINSMSETLLTHWGWRAAQNTTPNGGTFVLQNTLPVDASASPTPTYLPLPLNRVPF